MSWILWQLSVGHDSLVYCVATFAMPTLITDFLFVECINSHMLDELSLFDPQFQRCWEVCTQGPSKVLQGQVLNVKGK